MLCRCGFEFTKMHALGNDFMIFEAPAGGALPSRAQWRALADRHSGVGFDQALVLEPPRSAGSHAYYRIYNADGSEAEQCGNGARCIARYLQMQGPRPHCGQRCAWTAPAGRLKRGCSLMEASRHLGVPDFNPASLPFLVTAAEATYSMEVAARKYRVRRRFDRQSARRIAGGGGRERRRQRHRCRAAGASALSAPGQCGFHAGHRQRAHPPAVSMNVAWAKPWPAVPAPVRPSRSDATSGCSEPKVEVHVPGGRLGVHWDRPGERAWLTGPAAVAYTGRVEL